MSTICERQIAIFNYLNLTILLWYIYKLLQIKDFMKLSTKGRYAVMALADIAKFDNSRPVPLRDISLRQGISLLYLEQIFSMLKKNQIVESVRGSNGGYKLTKSPEQIKISNIFSAVQENIKTVGCKKESKRSCNGKSAKCITHNLWDDLETHINNFFEKNTLWDIVYRVNNNQQKEVNR